MVEWWQIEFLGNGGVDVCVDFSIDIDRFLKKGISPFKRDHHLRMILRVVLEHPCNEKDFFQIYTREVCLGADVDCGWSIVRPYILNRRDILSIKRLSLSNSIGSLLESGRLRSNCSNIVKYLAFGEIGTSQ